jgi:hypothetical protein
MRSIIISVIIIFFIIVTRLLSNNITGYEYWFDNDYASKYTGQILSEKSFQLLDTISIANLPAGIHKFNLRFKDSTGSWSEILSKTFIKQYDQSFNLTSNPTKSYEYWFDNDYASKYTGQILSEKSFQLLDTISVANLPSGIHKFNLRFKDSTGSWSEVLSKTFIKQYDQSFNLPSNPMKSYEYWFDNNYAAKFTRQTSTDNIFQLKDSVSVDNLPAGIHKFNLRFKDSTGSWSEVLSKTFIIRYDKYYNFASNPMKSYEFWFDNNYAGKFTGQTSTDNFFQLTDNISVDNLPAGIHKFNLRYKDSLGDWSEVISKTFIIRYDKYYNLTSNPLKSYEYWFDNNYAGKHSGQASSVESYHLLNNVNVTELSMGSHIFNLRFIDSTGSWSEVLSDTFFLIKEANNRFKLYLHKGWNIISSYIAPVDSSITIIFDSLMANILIIKTTPKEKYLPDSSNNTLNYWNSNSGYLLYSKASDSLTFVGSVIIPEYNPISLNQGWNLIPYIRNSPLDVDSALISIIDHIVIVQNGSGEFYFPFFGSNTLELGTSNQGKMLPGKGYWIYVTKPATLIYPGN